VTYLSFDSAACALAHGSVDPAPDGRALVAVFDSPVATHLLHIAATLGYRVALVDPLHGPVDWSPIDVNTDVVVTDHDRPELGTMLQGALSARDGDGQHARWIGVMGSARHTAPHIDALRSLGMSDRDIARVHRPIGLNIGSRTPAEIAVATLAGLLADRNARPGGFDF
jgi:xanthine/CO dehydrogenase XdhC/CoxF family maturation factor